MDGACYVIGILLAICATIVVAFPDSLVARMTSKKKRIPAKHWGQYQGTESNSAEGEEEPTIEVKTPARKVREIAGSQTYSAGRGVRMGG